MTLGLECIRDTCIFKPMPENQAAVAACSTWASWSRKLADDGLSDNDKKNLAGCL